MSRYFDVVCAENVYACVYTKEVLARCAPFKVATHVLEMTNMPKLQLVFLYEMSCQESREVPWQGFSSSTTPKYMWFVSVVPFVASSCARVLCARASSELMAILGWLLR